MTEHGGRERPPDDLDRVARELRGILRADAAGAELDWTRIALLRAERRRRRSRRIAATAGLATAASLAAALVVWQLLPPASGEGRGTPAPMPGAGRTAAAPAGPGWQLLHEAGDSRVVAAPGTKAVWDGLDEVTLETGRVAVRFRRDRGLAASTTLCVRAADLRACAHGTMFEVEAPEATGRETTVTVVEGVVRVERTGKPPIDVGAGRRLAASANEPVPIADGELAAVAAALGLPPPAAPAGPDGPANPAPREPVEAPGPVAAGEGPASVTAPPEPAPATAGGDAGTHPPGNSGAAPGTRDDLDTLYRAAERALAEGRPDDAVDLLRRIADAGPETAVGGRAMIDIGETLLRGGRPAEARRAFERYLAAHPRGGMRGEARIRVCRIDAAAGRLADALACYASYLAEFPAGLFASEARQATGEADRTGERGEP
ncbi:MAG: tetratricopeptide repeat protein [Deltaproteobacteria bacterium]|nr:tetratricopeptide repeat protein [Deltaproteobacteria bacterium]